MEDQPIEETVSETLPTSEAEDQQEVELTEEQIAALETASQPYVGRWNSVVSTTNWEKGHIIQEWRSALQEENVPATEFSDEAWSKRVGCVTGQHVGRLRRVHERFGDVREKFDKLFWSHFQASLDWNDAEMWLEGAVQNKWSVSNMRNNRWETMGKLEGDRPNEADIIVAELDEDFEAGSNTPGDDTITGTVGNMDPPSGMPVPEGPDFGDEDHPGVARETSAETEYEVDADPASLIKPFAEIGQLPEDVLEAFDAFKLAVLNHKAAGWKEIKLEEMVGCLESLKVLAQAPSGLPKTVTVEEKTEDQPED